MMINGNTMYHKPTVTLAIPILNHFIDTAQMTGLGAPIFSTYGDVRNSM